MTHSNINTQPHIIMTNQALKSTHTIQTCPINEISTKISSSINNSPLTKIFNKFTTSNKMISTCGLLPMKKMKPN